MRRLMRCRRMRPDSRRSGQATVELALIAPILLLIIFGLVDFARAWSAHHVIADAAREGTRMLVVHDPFVTQDVVETAILNRLATSKLNPNRAEIFFTPDGAVPPSGQPWTVRIEYEYNLWVLGIFMKFATGDQQLNLVSTVTMRSE